MELSQKQYMALSEIAYLNFENNNLSPDGSPGPYLNRKLSEFQVDKFLVRQDEHTPVNAFNSKGVFASVNDFELINYQNDNENSGFCGAAFKYKDEKGIHRIVFAFRGTEKDEIRHLPIPEDFLTDAQLALVGDPLDKPNQFNYAYEFVRNTIAIQENKKPDEKISDEELSSYIQSKGVSFTGHSLGGGLCQFLTYKTGGKSVTFNGVGIGQALRPDALLKKYDVLDFVNADDIIGNYGIQLGDTRYIQNHPTSENVNFADILNVLEAKLLAALSKKYNVEALTTISNIMSNMNKETSEYLDEELNFKYHGMETMLDSFGNTDTITPNATSSHIQGICNSLFIAATMISAGTYVVTQGIKNINDGIGSLNNAITDIKEDMSQAIQNNVNETKQKINEVIANAIPILRQDIIACGNDANAIKEEINASIQDIQTKINNIISDSSKQISEDISQISDGYSQLLDGLSIKDLINDILDSVSKGNGVGESALNETINNIKDAVSGFGNINSGLEQVVTDSINGFKESIGVIIEETGKGLWSIKDEVADLLVNSADIVNTLDQGIENMAASIGKGLLNVGSAFVSEISENFNSIISGISDLTEGLVETGSGILMLGIEIKGLLDFAFGKTIIDGLLNLFEDATKKLAPRIDPLVLDLNGNGIETIAPTEEIYFDLDNNGRAETTAWVGKDDGLLVYDRNEDWVINNGTELFGDHTLLKDGTYAASGFQALAEFDENGDGKIDASDSIFTKLRVWQDIKQDGFSESDELFKLTDLGISSINLGYTAVNTTLENGNVEMNKGSFSKTDGSTFDVSEMLLQRDTTSSISVEQININDEIKALPDISGNGNMYSLHEAMAKDSSGELENLIKQFVNETNKDKRHTLLTTILYKWASCDTVSQSSRGTNIDARQLVFLEKYLGKDFVGTNGPNPNITAAPILVQTFEMLSDRMYAVLMSQSHLEQYMSSLNILGGFDEVINKMDNTLTTDSVKGKNLLSEFVKNVEVLGMDNIPSFNNFKDYYSSQSEEYAWIIDSANKNVIEGSEWDDTLTGTNMDDALLGKANEDNISGDGGNDVIYGQDGYDTLIGGDGNDKINGGSGDDKLYGGNGNDTLIGGSGRDYMEGGIGNDVYVFDIGYGQDTIYDYDSTTDNKDKILIGKDLLPEDILLRRNDLHLEITIKGTDDKLVVNNYFESSKNFMIESIEFADGTVWNMDYIKGATGFIDGSEYGDNIQGYENDDVIKGMGGNDSIYGRYGNDTIDGGSGDDILYGEDGNDNLVGGTGNDKLYGGNGEDVLDGGAGSDYLEGSIGNNTYMFGRGYGSDTICDDDSTAGNIDKILISENVLPEDIAVKRNENDLVLSIKGTTDELRVTNYFYSYGNDVNRFTVEKVVFADGTIWDVDYIQQEAARGTDGDDSIKGYEKDDSLDGFEGNDTIYGYSGKDKLEGGADNDSLYGGDGNDTLMGEAGDDRLYGEQGDDILDGETGSDYLEGGDGNDTYIFGRGYGQDTIGEYSYTSGNADKIVMSSDIHPSDIAVRRDGGNLELSIKGTKDKLTINSYFSNDAHKVEKVEFADGTVWDSTYFMMTAGQSTSGNDYIQGYEINDILAGQEGDDTVYGYGGNDSLDGGAGNDTLDGGDGSDVLIGGVGNDRLYGGQGNDTLDGGLGSDDLEGGNGNDTYVFGRGYGQDVIYDNDYTAGNIDKIMMASDVLPSDIIVRRNSDNLELCIRDTDDKITVSNYFSNDSYKVEKVQFSDGTTWDVSAIKELGMKGTENDDTLYGYEISDNLSGKAGNDMFYGYSGDDVLDGGAGNDTLYGGDGKDTLTGGTGDDRLYGEKGEDTLDGGEGNDSLDGSSGNDTYMFGRGYGQDVISDNDSTAGNVDKIVMASDTLPADLIVVRNGNNLQLSISGTTDKITVNNYFYSYDDSYKIEKVEFSDGTVWDTVYIKEAVTKGAEENDTLLGYDTNDVIEGRDGNDTGYGYAGDDVLDGGEGNDILYGGDGKDTLTGGSNDDSLYGEQGEDTLDGGLGDDNLYGGDGKDILTGNVGDDRLYGEQGEDTLDGGGGSDHLEGGNGNDIYVFGRGYGQDTISDYDYSEDNTDKIVMALDILPSEIILTRDNYNLELSIDGTADKITVTNYFYDDSYKIEKVEFADGTVWDKEYITNQVISTGDTLTGSDADDVLMGKTGNDTLYGYAGNDTLNGGAGRDTLDGGDGNDSLTGGLSDDRLYGGQGEDVLDGGIGDDYLDGGSGNDTYVFGRGYGQDTIGDCDYTENNLDKIVMKQDVLPSDISIRRNSNDLELSIKGTTDKLTISNYFYNDAYKVEKIQFSNGTIWSIATIKEMISKGSDDDDILYGYDIDDNLSGQAGNDKIYGYSGNDSLNGGVGNDYLEGGYGNDTYVFGRGYGQDTIADYDYTKDNVDKIVMSSDIHPSDIIIKRNNYDLELSIKDTNDKITVSSYFSNNNSKVEKVEFGDGTVWNIAYIEAEATKGSEGDDLLQGYESNDVIEGYEGNDTEYGYSGDDSLDGGAGNDDMHGGDGKDTLMGETGDDRLYGDQGDDTLDGGTGNDYLEGGYGNDTYVFGRGYGQDTISDYKYYDTTGDIDRIVMTSAVVPSDVTVKRVDNNLELSINGTTDKITVNNYFGNDDYKVEKVEFADGTVWDTSWIKKAAIKGTPSDDIIRGYETDDILSSKEGNDTIYGYDGNDFLDGGLGNDVLYGGAGTDKILGATGDDTIYGEDGNDSLSGGNGNDSLYGGNGDDTLDGGVGNDNLQGESGNDTYIFRRGYGQDTINDYDYTSDNLDKIVMASDILPSDVIVKRNGSGLELSIKDTTDKITISNYFSNENYKIEKIEFGDGTTWNDTNIKEAVTKGSEDDETLYGYDNNDTIIGYGGNDNLYGYVGDDLLDGGSGNDYLNGGEGSDIISGGTGDDNIYGEYGDDTLKGDKGNDTLYGGDGNDTFDGGVGNDSMEGNAGNDIYVFGKGYGQDVVYDYDTTEGNVDKIVMTDRVLPAEVQAVRNGSNLELIIKGTKDKLTVSNYFNNDNYKIEKIEFADGTVWDTSYIHDVVKYIYGNEFNDTLQGSNEEDIIRGFGGNDNLSGYDGNDTIDGGEGTDSLNGGNGDDLLRGGEGDDTLYGSSGDDRLDGQEGDDTLQGDEGNDVYIFGKGYGRDTINNYNYGNGSTDTISMTENVLPEEVQAVRNGSNLELIIKGTNDNLIVNNYFDSNNYYKIDKITFANGTTWDNTYISDAVRYITGTDKDERLNGYEGDDIITGLSGYDTIYGYEGKDTLDGGSGDDTLYGGNGGDIITGEEGYDHLYGENGSDTLDGGVGNDILEGGSGDDIYKFGLGYGEDQINEYDWETTNIDTISMEDGITPDSVTVRRNGNQLEFIIKNTTDKLTVNNYFNNSAYRVEKVKFADGTEWDEVKLKDMARFMNGTEKDDTIRGYYDYSQDNVISGMAGNDSLYGNGGNDILNGGVGDDKLYGESGSDTLAGEAGNDYMEGGYGSDNYLFGRGYGRDSISEYSSQDDMNTIKFIGDLTPSDIKIVKVIDNSLELKISGTEDSLIVSSYFSNGNYIQQVEFSDGTVWDNDYISKNISYIRGTEGGDYNIAGSSSGELIYGLGGDDGLYGYDGADTLDGGIGNDTIYGGNGNDRLTGSEGNDNLYGEAGEDTLGGGKGDDYLDGGIGNDCYAFNLGDGHDTINDFDNTTGNLDKVLFGEGILPENVVFSRQDTNLKISIKGTSDELTIKGYFDNYYGNNYSIEKFQFSNGTVWEKADLQKQKFYVYGSDNDDNVSYFSNSTNVMHGYNGNDTFTGGSGNDELYGESGDDTLNGGSGIDKLYGDEGNDSINGQDGDDILEGGLGNDFMDGGTGADTLKGGMGNDTLSGGDGSDLLYGEEGNDSINGGSGEDFIDGGVGYDYLSGGLGNDTYIFKLGYGNDTISDYDYTKGNIDTVVFGEGISSDKIALSRNGNNLEFNFEGITDKLTIVNGYYDNSYGYNEIEKFQFADGTVWSSSDIESKQIYTYGTEVDDIVTCSTDVQDTMYGYAGNDTLYGGGGDDIIYGGSGSDLLDGGTGNDKLYGDQGDNSIFGGQGADILISGSGSDYMDGGEGDDKLESGSGNDMLYGGDGQDTLDGGTGDDYLDGGSGSDTYIFKSGFGNDTIYDFDSTGENKDTIYFNEKLLDLIFTSKGNNLLITVNGTEDSVTINDWYSNSSYKTEEFKAADDMKLSYVQVEQLIQAMASFTQEKGISWNQAIKDRPEDVQNVLSQFWVRQSV